MRGITSNVFNLFSLIIFLFFLKNADGQDFTNKKKFLLNGIILDSQLRQSPIGDVGILNLSTRESFNSDENGNFAIKIGDGDTLRFHKLGYHSKFYFFKKILEVENYSIQILLTNDTIALKPFVYKSITKEKQIQNAFMNSYIRDSLRMIEYLKKMVINSNKSFLEEASEMYTNPVTFLYDQFGKKARQRSRIDRYRQILKEEKEKREPDYAK